jgi:DNA primase
MIPQSFIQDLLSRVDIVDVVESAVQLKRAGANYSACCPFHTEKTPSFTVSPAKQFYHCFGCGAHGTAISFLMEYHGMGFIDAVKDLASRVGMTVPEPDPAFRRQTETPAGPDLTELLADAARYYKEQLKRSEVAIRYLKGRGLTGEIAARFGLGFAPDGWQNLEAVFPNYADKALVDAGLIIQNEEGRRYDRFRDRIMFPIVNPRGDIIGFGGRVLGQGEPKYLNSPETPVFEKGRELYGLFQARQAIRAAGRVLVVEGYMDVVALAQHGVEYAVATLGTATTPVHVQKLLRQTDEVVFAFDGDKAGRKAAWRALEQSLAALADGKQIRFLFLPEGEDPDTYIRSQGREAFEALVAQAEPLSRYLLDELQANVDMATPEGRAAFLKQAEGLVKQITARNLGLAMRDAIARAAGLTLDRLDEQFGYTRSRPAVGRAVQAPPAAPRKVAGQQADEVVLRALMAKPDLYPLCAEALEFLAASPLVSLAGSLVAALREGVVELTGPAVAVYLEAAGEVELVKQVQTKCLELERGYPYDYEQELRDQLVKLKALHEAERRRLAIEGKLSASQLSEQEQNLFRRGAGEASGAPL